MMSFATLNADTLEHFSSFAGHSLLTALCQTTSSTSGVASVRSMLRLMEARLHHVRCRCVGPAVGLLRRLPLTQVVEMRATNDD